ncbi:expressed hypothetical protein [Trichoplax adhaerens]|uniref:Isopropylmalate dehydrogenase-like domain-containing protein n=1 Tax=Trichoplax adhaerens TaxID=10228 RepID=B3RY01_TRIAD|nr:expressed hypothetical protein [Trichoplax adhaerens]EDV24515.1 expressed hypothetical protein [Trichoplax adhaerens]|eukprot:XP_002112405.1 expressed hypothetical protein [Trichoplax adhaerens]
MKREEILYIYSSKKYTHNSRTAAAATDTVVGTAYYKIDTARITGNSVISSYMYLFNLQGLHMQFYPIGHRLLSSSKANYAFSQYGGRYTVTLIPGDGIGPEMARHVKTVLHKCGAPIDFEVIDIKDESSTDAAIISLKRNGIGLKGTITTNISNPQSQSINAQIRRKLDLYSNIVPCKSIPGVWTRHGQVDLVVIRENTEGEYGSLEHENVDGVVESLKIITEKKSRRIAKFAFDYALQNNRRKVTAIHKANIMKLADGLFLETCREISKDYTDIEFESMIIDNCCMQMVTNPQQFDVMVMPNLYGNIVSHIGIGLVGGIGLVPGKNIGDKYAIFESGARNIGSDLVGLNRANPCGFLFTSALMLRHLGLDDYADIIESAVRTTIKNGKCRTPDIQGDRTTADFIDAVIKEIDVQ